MKLEESFRLVVNLYIAQLLKSATAPDFCCWSLSRPVLTQSIGEKSSNQADCTSSRYSSTRAFQSTTYRLDWAPRTEDTGSHCHFLVEWWEVMCIKNGSFAVSRCPSLFVCRQAPIIQATHLSSKTRLPDI